MNLSLDQPAPIYDCVAEHVRAVVLARHDRGAEGLSIAQIADRLGRSQATVKGLFLQRHLGESARGQARACRSVPLWRLHPFGFWPPRRDRTRGPLGRSVGVGVGGEVGAAKLGDHRNQDEETA